jgi:TELO2-interacting protein 1
MGRQLLILMSLLAGGSAQPGGRAPTEEIQVLAFQCVQVITEQVTAGADSNDLFDESDSKSVVDQIVYLLLEAITDAQAEHVQLAATNTLTAIVTSIQSRVLLASLLPRTASAITKAVKPTTRARRTQKTLTAHLNLLRFLLRALLRDDIVFSQSSDTSSQPYEQASREVLDAAWLKATTNQVKLVLVQVSSLRNHSSSNVRTALSELCLMVIDECPRSLSESLPVAIEALLYGAHLSDGQTTMSRLELIAQTEPHVEDILRAKLYDWSHALARTMQSSEDRIKERLFGQLSTALTVISKISQLSEETLSILVQGLLQGISNITLASDRPKMITEGSTELTTPLTEMEVKTHINFSPVLLTRANESSTRRQIRELLDHIDHQGLSGRLARICIDGMTDGAQSEQLPASWLALQALSRSSPPLHALDSILVFEDVNDIGSSRPQLVSELYANTLVWLTGHDDLVDTSDWRLAAIAVESTVLQAQQMGKGYRPELMDTLYPLISLLGSRTFQLREHASTGLSMLASACSYNSVGEMLIDNADYLINSVGMKLNSFDITPQAPRVLLMMLRLCGARIIPQMDDLIGSIFSALDNYHGYPALVDDLFKVLQALVRESTAQPQLAITDMMDHPDHARSTDIASTTRDIISDLSRRSALRAEFAAKEVASISAHPQEAWNTPQTITTDDTSADSEADQGVDQFGTDTDGATTLSTSYKLLLSIGQSVSPHLTSPSAQVRQTLLQLVDEAIPLLARHEDSFLPLVNTLWPVVAPRLVTYRTDLEARQHETAYNACAAADVIGSLCKGAGNFMASRIDDFLPQLRQLFLDVHGHTGFGEGRSALHGTRSSLEHLRSPRGQVTTALHRLLRSILLYVRLTDDASDQVFGMLSSHGGPGDPLQVDQALEMYNADAFWLLEQSKANSLADVR